jgi:arylsulfatase A-like enzyme
LPGDNGLTAWPRYCSSGPDAAPGSTGAYRGRKWSLYEGGIRLPLIVRWPGEIKAGRVDRDTILGAVDLFPPFASLAGLALPAESAGEDISRPWRGARHQRKQPLLWEYGRDKRYLSARRQKGSKSQPGDPRRALKAAHERRWWRRRIVRLPLVAERAIERRAQASGCGEAAHRTIARMAPIVTVAS